MSDKRTVIIEVSGGVLEAVHGVDEYILVDWDNISQGDEPPELPEGYEYADGWVIETSKEN